MPKVATIIGNLGHQEGFGLCDARVQVVKAWDEFGAESGNLHIQVIKARTKGFRCLDAVVQIAKAWDDVGAESGSPRVQVVEARTKGFRCCDAVVQIVEAGVEFGTESGSHGGGHAVKVVVYYPQYK
jgi:hypothetical protein